MKKLFFIAIILGHYMASLSAQVSIVKIVDWTLSPRQLTKVGNQLYFVASDTYEHEQIWKSDGSAAGTVMVCDLTNLGAWWADELTDFNGTLFFTAVTQANGKEVWKCTNNGAVMVKDVFPGANGSAPEQLTAVENHLYFVCDDGIHGAELWISDGSSLGTFLLKDIVPGPDEGVVKNLTAFNNLLYFSAGNYIFHNYAGLYRSDGSSSGTQLVKAISIGSLLTFRAAAGYLYFTIDTGFDNNIVWLSDGTETGTLEAWNFCGDISQLVNANGVLFLGADDCTHYPDARNELCKIRPNLTNSGLIKDICPTIESDIREITAWGNFAVFSADDCANGAELWYSDGTVNGTYMVKNIRYGYLGAYPQGLTISNNILYFTANPGDASGPATGRELWRSNGTEAGTYLVKDIRPGASGSEPRELIDVNNILFFVAYDDQNEEQLWRTGGTSEASDWAWNKTGSRIQPTLARQWINIESDPSVVMQGDFHVVNITGQIYMTVPSDSKTIDIGALPEGAYWFVCGNAPVGRFFKL